MEHTGLYFKGVVITGEGEAGPLYGMPTANLCFSAQPDIDTGIYAARVNHAGKHYNAVVCYGPDLKPKFEVHLFEFSQNIIGEELEGNILEKISEFVDLYSIERIRQKILHDIELVKDYFQTHSL